MSHEQNLRMTDASSGSVVLRDASDADIPRLVEVICAAFAEYGGWLDLPSSAQRKSIAVVRAELTGGGAFVALLDELVVGSVFYHPYPEHMYLDRLAVLPDYRRRGIAQALITAVESRTHALDLGAVRLSVRVALAENRAFYERLGYTLLSYGTHAGYTSPTFVHTSEAVVVRST